MSVATLIRRMAEAGATPEAIALAVEAVEAEQAKDADRRAKRAEQKRQERERRATVARQDGDNKRHGSDTPQKEISPTPPKEKLPPSSEPNGSGVSVARANDLSDFKAELTDLDAERIEAIIKHRRAKRGQLTGHSARLFRRDAEVCGLSLADAVDTCISRNWITVKPEWIDKPAPRATPPPERNVLADIKSGKVEVPNVLDLINGKSHEPAHSGPTIDASFERTDRGGSGNPVQVHAIPPRH